MTDKTTDANSMELQADDVELKKRLIKRVAVAGVLIAILLGGLAVLDNLNAPPIKLPEQAPVLAVSEPKPVEAKPEEKVEEKPAEPAKLEEAKAEEVPATPETSSSPSAPNRKTRPGRVDRPPTKPAEPKLAMLKPSETVSTPRPAEPAAELVRPPRGPAPASRPLSQPLVRSGNFLLQMGVFNSTANAEELRAKLELNGIPSQIEARVQVGPFSSRLEAEQMRDTLKQLGMETGMVVALKK